jgi:hypothetical protein
MSDGSTGKAKRRGFFRCPVQQDQASAELWIGRRRLAATLQETSIDGFTLVVEASMAVHLQVGRPWILQTSAERSEVHVEWLFHAPGGAVQLGVRRLRDLTPLPSFNSWRPRLLIQGSTNRRVGHSATPELLFFALLACLFGALSLPGIGDQLGTAPRIRRVVQALLSEADRVVSMLW